MLHRERYDAGAAAAQVAHYDAVMGDFYTGQGLSQPDGSQHVVARLASAGTLLGREHLVAISLGFLTYFVLDVWGPAWRRRRAPG